MQGYIGLPGIQSLFGALPACLLWRKHYFPSGTHRKYLSGHVARKSSLWSLSHKICGLRLVTRHRTPITQLLRSPLLLLSRLFPKFSKLADFIDHLFRYVKIIWGKQSIRREWSTASASHVALKMFTHPKGDENDNWLKLLKAMFFIFYL